MSTALKMLIEGVIALLVGIVVAVITYQFGLTKGSEGKKPGFDQITTQVRLDKTTWEVSYEEAIPQSTSPPQQGQPRQGPAMKATPTPTLIRVATVEFNQYGSRIVGEGRDNTGRKWIVEGAAAERRVCYIYFDTEGQRLSFGTVLLELDNSGRQMTGQWSGWSPESNQPQPRKVTLKKLGD